MLLGNYATGGYEAKRLHDYWHTRCSWYGPSGIDTARKINGFIDWYQISFFNELPDRVGDPHAGHLFADGNFTAFTTWPGMYMKVSGSGWLGIALGDQKNLYAKSLFLIIRECLDSRELGFSRHTFCL